LRDKDSHKGHYGKTLFVAGSSHYLGASYLAALSFLKAGGGLSYLAIPETLSSFIGNKGNEIVLIPQKATATDSIGLENKQRLLEFSEKVDMVIMGPGLSLHSETQKLVQELSAEIKKPLLIDGDGITAVSYDLECVIKREGPTILTPHLGEMARITGQKAEDMVENKVEILQNTAAKLKATIALKGAHTLIAYPDRRVFVNLSGNPVMATAGSGDVLTGTIAAMFGIGFSMNEAVRTGVFIHGFAGDLAIKDKGEVGLLASDIMDYVPTAMKKYREEFDSISADFYHKIFLI
jgi:NAD(P)H-hydrate epimerase